MVKITKVYTRTGDKGQTGLVGGRRIAKDHPRIASYGSVDELNSIIGIVRSFNAASMAEAASAEGAYSEDSSEPEGQSIRREKFEIILEAIQQKLFDLGSQLATMPGDEYEGMMLIKEADVKLLEEIMDTMNAELEPLRSFILPGGGRIPAFLHQARTVCRRAERDIWTLSSINNKTTETTDSDKEEVAEWILPYVNRLSDALFVFARWVAVHLGEGETLWKPGKDMPDWKWK